LPDGPSGDVLALTPPFSISDKEIDFAVKTMEHSLVNSSAI